MDCESGAIVSPIMQKQGRRFSTARAIASLRRNIDPAHDDSARDHFLSAAVQFCTSVIGAISCCSTVESTRNRFPSADTS